MDYLIGQAKVFQKSEEFQDAVDIAQYILASVDEDSKAATDLLEELKKALSAEIDKASKDVKKSIGDLSQ